jgi:hypothetical protein
MISYKKNDIVKLGSGKVVLILNLPTSFMSNGSYEVIECSDDNFSIKIGKPFWIKPEEIIYPINKEMVDDINKYFEVIWDENGLNLIPKDISSIDIESDREDFNRIKINYDEGRKHKIVNIHIGSTQIKDTQKITVRPEKEKKGKIESIINILNNKEDEI